MKALSGFFCQVIPTQIVHSKLLEILVLLAGIVGLNACENSATPISGRTGVLHDGISYSTYLDTGGVGTLREGVFDSEGNLIVAGHVTAAPKKFPNTRIIGVMDDSNIIVAKISSDGSHLVWVTLIGGTGKDRGYGVDLDRLGNIYLAGRTSSKDFPTTPGAFDRTHNGGINPVGHPHGPSDAYVLKLSSDGSKLIFSTFLGGAKEDGARGGVAVDEEGNSYVCGSTQSENFLDNNPAKVNEYHGGFSDAFITKVSPDGKTIIYSRYLGSTDDTKGEEVVVGCQIDSFGHVYANSILWGTDADTTSGAYDNTYNGGDTDLYIAKVSPDGIGLVFATYFGGKNEEFADHRGELDSQGNFYIVGSTLSPNFPTIQAHQTSLIGKNDSFLVKFNPSGMPVLSTYIGGSGEEITFGPTVSPSGHIYVGGLTTSSDLEVTPQALYGTYSGGEGDGYLQIYSSTGALMYSTYIGGSGREIARFVASDSLGNPFLMGEVSSQDYPTTPRAYQTELQGKMDTFITKFNISSLKLLDESTAQR